MPNKARRENRQAKFIRTKDKNGRSTRIRNYNTENENGRNDRRIGHPFGDALTQNEDVKISCM